MAKRRRFTPEFKAELVFEVLSGVSSQAEVCRRHNLNENQLLYHQKRPHSALGYLTPMEFQQQTLS